MNILEGEIVGSRAARYLDYVDAIQIGELVTRQDMAQRLSVSYSTARYNLDRAVLEGELNKVYGFASKTQPGWLYALRDTLPRMEGM